VQEQYKVVTMVRRTITEEECLVGGARVRVQGGRECSRGSSRDVEHREVQAASEVDVRPGGQVYQ
jgi:hypothetical protein